MEEEKQHMSESAEKSERSAEQRVEETQPKPMETPSDSTEVGDKEEKRLAVEMSEEEASLREKQGLQVIRGEYDEEGMYFYQAYNDAIADWAVEHQKLGGPQFKPVRMTWIKPSFAWMLYRSGYAGKPNQTRVLKIKLSHESVARILSHCKLSKSDGGKKNDPGSNGRVQWDPERDMWMSADGRDPRKMLRRRAIQIGIKGPVSKLFVESALSIQDVTGLARDIGKAHRKKSALECKKHMELLSPHLPMERPYHPLCPVDVQKRLLISQ